MKYMDKKYVLDKLEGKRKLDPDCIGFGVERHRYKLRPPIKEKKLEKLEQEFGIELPGEYREFLLSIGNGGAGPSYGLYSIQGALTGKDPTYRYPSSPVGEEIRQEFIRPEEHTGDYIPDEVGILILCQHGCANDDFLVLNGDEKGTVWEMLEWVGHLVPMLKEPIDLTYINKIPEDQKKEEERKWISRHLAAKKEEQMSFNDWYSAWLEKPPYILKNAKKRKRFLFW